MDLTGFVESLQERIVAAADMGGPETRAVVDGLSAGLDAATRLVLLETISAAADEITTELAPGMVEVRLHGSDPSFVVTLPSDAGAWRAAEAVTSLDVTPGGEEGETSRLNLRLPAGLKTRIEEAARREGLSLNAWLVRAAATSVEGGQGITARPAPGNQRYTGWVR